MAEEDFGSWLKSAIRESIVSAAHGEGAVMADRYPWMGTVPNGVVSKEGMDRLIEGSPEGNVEVRGGNSTLNALRHFYGNVGKSAYQRPIPPAPPSGLGTQAGYWEIGDERDPVDSSYRGRR